MILLNERINIIKLEDKIVNGRRQGTEETKLYTCWADILDLYGKELYEAMNTKLENTIVFKVRYCSLLEKLRKKDDYLVEWRNNKYKIYHVDFLNYSKKYVKIKCIEVI